MMKVCKEISELTRDEISELVDSLETVIFDCDGVLWRGSTEIPGAVDFVNFASQKLGKKVIFVTNNCCKTRQENLDKIRHFGIQADLDSVFHAGYLCALKLKSLGLKKGEKVFVAGGGSAIVGELKDMGIESITTKFDYPPDGWNKELGGAAIFSGLDPQVKAVVIGFDINISYPKITTAANYLYQKDDIHFLGSNRDASFPIEGMSLPGTGAMIKSVEVSTGRTASICGKPSEFVFEAVKMKFPTIESSRTLIVGDSVRSDILLGNRCGLQTLLVETGVNNLSDVRGFENSGDAELVPDLLAPNLEHVKNAIMKAM